MNVLITGASRGVGRAIASRLARPGGRVIVNYVRSEEAAQEVAREVEAKGAEALVIQGDVRDPKDLERLAAALPSLDALIHNAAIGVLKPYDKIRTNQWDLTMESSVLAESHAALAAIEAVEPTHPQLAAAWFKLALAHQEQRDDAATRRVLAHLRQRHPDSPEAGKATLLLG